MNHDSLTHVFTGFRERLRLMAAAIAGREDADDIVSEAFCRLWSRHKAVSDEREALRLSYTAVRNGAIDRLRSARERRETSLDVIESASAVPSDDDELSERKETYRAVVSLSRRVLDGKKLEVFTLHDIEGLEYDDIALRLGMTPENVRVTLSRARKQIRQLYKDER